MADFTTRLRELMDEKNLNAAQMGELSGVNRMTIYGYLNPWKYPDRAMFPNMNTFEKICDALDVSMDYLWGRSDRR